MRVAVKLPWLLRALHLVILANFFAEMAYAAWMIFFVVVPGVSGPLGGAATQLPFETMTTRRLYAVEFWLATVGFSLYVAITEILPRRLASK